MLAVDPPRGEARGGDRAHSRSASSISGASSIASSRRGRGARDGAAPRASRRQPGRARSARWVVPARRRAAASARARESTRPAPRRHLSGARAPRSRRDLLPAAPLGACDVRHTVGLADALTADRPRGLKIAWTTACRRISRRRSAPTGCATSRSSWSATPSATSAPAADSSRCSSARPSGEWLVTLDGNENFHDFEAFREFWEAGARRAGAARICGRTCWSSNSRSTATSALSDESGAALRAWPDRPPLIIDESDGAVGDVPRALALGYAGASHKNCKGIVKGLANAALLRRQRGVPAAGAS